MVIGAAAGGVIHLVAELIDNALRYSPPTTVVRISAARGGDAGVLLRIADSGLGMNDADQRIANTRLQAGGEVTPDNARHMGLFVVGRIAARHGIRVGLRGATAGEAGSGTTAEVYLPPAVLEGTAVVRAAGPHEYERPVSPPAAAAVPQAARQTVRQHEAPPEAPPEGANQNGFGNASGPPITLLPRRSPGSSGITDVPAQPPEQPPRRPRRELATPAWTNGDAREAEHAPAQAPVQAASDTSAFFAARSRHATDQADASAADTPSPPAGAVVRAVPPAAEVPAHIPADDDVIYRRMLSEMADDPLELPDLDWKSVWDKGWSLAAAAEDQPVESHTADHGLPVRTPGARLVPGTANETDEDGAESAAASNGGFQSQPQPQHAASLRDPDAVRASFSSHFDGVRSGRSHASETLETHERPDQQ
jgi:hypothetical protein